MAIETEGIGIGQSIVDPRNFYRHSTNAIVLMDVDPNAFFRLFFTRLLHLETEPDLLDKLIKE